MTLLEDILLKDTSPKYTNLSPSSIKVNIQKIQENEKNDETEKLALNLSFLNSLKFFF